MKNQETENTKPDCFASEPDDYSRCVGCTFITECSDEIVDPSISLTGDKGEHKC